MKKAYSFYTLLIKKSYAFVHNGTLYLRLEYRNQILSILDLANCPVSLMELFYDNYNEPRRSLRIKEMAAKNINGVQENKPSGYVKVIDSAHYCKYPDGYIQEAYNVAWFGNDFHLNELKQKINSNELKLTPKDIDFINKLTKAAQEYLEKGGFKIGTEETTSSTTYIASANEYMLFLKNNKIHAIPKPKTEIEVDDNEEEMVEEDPHDDDSVGEKSETESIDENGQLNSVEKSSSSRPMDSTSSDNPEGSNCIDKGIEFTQREPVKPPTGEVEDDDEEGNSDQTIENDEASEPTPNESDVQEEQMDSMVKSTTSLMVTTTDPEDTNGKKKEEVEFDEQIKEAPESPEPIPSLMFNDSSDSQTEDKSEQTIESYAHSVQMSTESDAFNEQMNRAVESTPLLMGTATDKPEESKDKTKEHEVEVARDGQSNETHEHAVPSPISIINHSSDNQAVNELDALIEPGACQTVALGSPTNSLLVDEAALEEPEQVPILPDHSESNEIDPLQPATQQQPTSFANADTITFTTPPRVNVLLGANQIVENLGAGPSNGQPKNHSASLNGLISNKPKIDTYNDAKISVEEMCKLMGFANSD